MHVRRSNFDIVSKWMDVLSQFLTFWQGHHCSFLSPIVVTKFQWVWYHWNSVGRYIRRVEKFCKYCRLSRKWYKTGLAYGYYGSPIGSHRWPFTPCWFQLPWVTFEMWDLHNYTPTIWPRATKYAVETREGEQRVSRGLDMRLS